MKGWGGGGGANVAGSNNKPNVVSRLVHAN